MEYISTRGNYRSVEAAEAILKGMVPAGGLFVPEKIPVFTQNEIFQMEDLSYQKIAIQVLKKFLTDYSQQELEEAVGGAYNSQKFPADRITPYHKLKDGMYILELWHGPTAAFKDIALQVMPYLLVQAVAKGSIDREIVILVATSGDTGKAALEGFKDVSGISIIVFFPENGVSKIQEKQMVTTDGNNTFVVALKGNFDDCQSGVKEIFSDSEFNKALNTGGYQFSSANSINWGRLLPQLVYYFAIYAYLLKDGELNPGEKINITVPTGNFGNILAGYYAYEMGLPVNKFICASNDNKVLKDFIDTGTYDINRDFKKTISPSMDILISSNLERFLFEMNGHRADKINEWYHQLQQTGKFSIDRETKSKIDDILVGEYAVEEEAMSAIENTYHDYNYLIDPHTAVGVSSFYNYSQNSRDKTPVVIDATANPYKFGEAVFKSLEDKVEDKVEIDNEFEYLERLQEMTGNKIHRCLQRLGQQPTKHNRKCSQKNMKQEIRDILDI